MNGPNHPRLAASPRGLLILALSAAALTGGSAEAAFSSRTVSVGTSWNLGQHNPGANVTSPAASDIGVVVGIGIAGSNDHVYYWYADGTVSSGTSTNFVYHSPKTTYTLPSGQDPWDIVTTAIAGSNDHVYAWYANGKVSEGTSTNLSAHSGGTVDFTLPPGKVVGDIVGIGIAGSNDHVFAWYSDGTVSEGTTTDLDAYQAPYAFSVPAGKKIGHIIDIAIAGSNDYVYAWYHDVEAGSGHSTIADRVDARAMDILRRYRLPGLSVAVSKNGRVILEKGYGYANFDTGARMQPTSRCRIGSVSKVITALGAMHLHENNAGFSVNQNVYTGGPLFAGPYAWAQDWGVARHQPIVAKAIASDDHVYTWYHNGQVTAGTSQNPDVYSGPKSYTIPDNLTPEDIRAIAIAPNDWVWAWYEDGTFSAGTSRNLGAHVPRDPNAKVKLPSNYAGTSVGYGMSHIVGIAIAPSNSVYVWYDDGMQSAGTTSDFTASIAPRSYSTGASSRYLIRGMGIAKSNSHVYTWYTNGKVDEGHSRDLDAYATGPTYTTPAYAYDGTKDWDDWYGAMKINHLLSHTAGFIRSGDVEGAAEMYNLQPNAMGYDLAHQYILRTRKLLFAPGTGRSYSNHGAGLVGHIVATVSGMSYKSYVRGNIIDPLGLQIRSFSEGQTALDAYRHDYDGNGIPYAYIDDDNHDLGLAAGGWKSSAGDLVRLTLATDQDPTHPDVLSAATLNLMESRPYPNVSTNAHGWDKNDQGKLAHNGRLGGGTTYLAKYPAGYLGNVFDPISVAVCTNISISDARGGATPLTTLAGEIANVANEANISLNYDLY